MCGIYGSTIKYNDDVVLSKLSVINFRGPDYCGIVQTDRVILGHNRLAILDLDKRSNQPFNYLHLQIVFNGEVYNYNEIKEKLVAKGFSFSTKSDTEVICAAYLAYGKDCVNHFNGMFAFVIYDTRKQELFGARDRLGKKPLYYSHQGKAFEFASQSSQIKIGRSMSFDKQSIEDYLIWGYISEPNSIWQEINQLPAGSYFVYDLDQGNLDIEKYWDIDFERTNIFTGSYEEAKAHLKEILIDAVSLRMQADVPLGVFLSGGIDSSLVAAIAASQRKRVKTFSIKFQEKGFDESQYAIQVAEHLRTEHHTIVCNYNEGIELINNFSTYYDEPFADSSAIPTMLLSKHTRKKVTVALSGDGGDEAFAGYDRYKWINLVNKSIFKLPLPIRKSIGKLVAMSPKYKHKLIGMGVGVKDIESLYIKMLGGLENSWIKDPEKGMATPFMHIFEEDPEKDFLEKVSDFDIKTYLNGDINTKVDRASMAFSLESRAPLMDYRVVEFSRSLPLNFKYNKGNQKVILKDVLYDYLPQRLFERPKSGFTMPFKDWFRNELKSYVLDNLSKSNLEQIPGINIQRTQEIIKDHMDGKWNRYPQIWKLLVLSQWLKKHNASG